jgi:transcriptional regulator with XRE-family HTH domain
MRRLYLSARSIVYAATKKDFRGVHIAERFERLLEAHPRPDGRAWTGADLQRATGAVVTRSYVTNLRKGRIENPGHDKMEALSKAMGFPPALWFDNGDGVTSDSELDQDLMVALRDETVQKIARENSRLAGREKEIVLGIVRQFRAQRT